MKVISYTIRVLYPPENDQSESREEFLHRERLCRTDVEFNEHLSIAKAEAYNGEYTIEDDGQPEPEPEPTQLDRVEAQATYTAMMTDTLLEV